VAGVQAISASKTNPEAGSSVTFLPLDHALIQAMACEVIADIEEPLSRKSLADLVSRAQSPLSKKDQPQRWVADIPRAGDQSLAA
jgi:hypothetical protein